MQLYILDKEPTKSAQLVPDKYKFKMLIELSQLICSAGISSAYKPIKQGRELQQWVKENRIWTYNYFCTLLDWCYINVNMKQETINRLMVIKWSLFDSCIYKTEIKPLSAHFRYKEDYKCDIPSKTLLPINNCIEQYRKYLTEFKKVELGTINVQQ